jgi:hypothetical protein
LAGADDTILGRIRHNLEAEATDAYQIVCDLLVVETTERGHPASVALPNDHTKITTGSFALTLTH